MSELGSSAWRPSPPISVANSDSAARRTVSPRGLFLRWHARVRDSPHASDNNAPKRRVVVHGRFTLPRHATASPAMLPSYRRRNTVIKACLAMGWPIPMKLRHHHILNNVYRPAIAAYRPSPFAGRAVYIKSEERPSKHAEQWRRLCLGGSDIHKVAGCNHHTIMESPCARLLGTKVERALAEDNEMNDCEAFIFPQESQRSERPAPA